MNLRQRCFFAAPPLDTARLRIRGLGVRDELPPCRIDRPRGTGDHFVLCAHDAARVDDAVELRPGEVVIWSPGMRQCYGSGRGFRHSWLHADGTIIEDLLRRSALPVGVPVAPGSGHCSERALGAIFDELRSPQPEEEIVAALLTAWCLALARNHRGTLAPSDPVVATRQFIEVHLADALTLGGLARDAGMSPQHLSRRFKALVGTSPIAYQLGLRMERAAWLLRDVERSVASVGAQVGYADLYQFSRAFSRHHGCSPSAWRKRLLHRAGSPG